MRSPIRSRLKFVDFDLALEVPRSVRLHNFDVVVSYSGSDCNCLSSRSIFSGAQYKQEIEDKGFSRRSNDGEWLCRTIYVHVAHEFMKM